MPDNLKNVEGNIAEIDYDNRFFTLEDRAGAVFIKIFWKPPFEEKMKKQKAGYYEAPTVEMSGDKEAVLIDLPWKERGDFPRSQHRQQQKGGGRPFQPRNEKLIVYQTTYKEACETVRSLLLCSDQTFDEAEYNRLMDIALARAIKDGKALIEAGGA